MTNLQPIAKAASNLCVWSAHILDEPSSLDKILEESGFQLLPLRNSIVRSFSGLIAAQEMFFRRALDQKYDKHLGLQRLDLTALLGYDEMLPGAFALFSASKSASPQDKRSTAHERGAVSVSEFDLDTIRHLNCLFEMLPVTRAERRNYVVKQAMATRQTDRSAVVQSSITQNLHAITKALEDHDQLALRQGTPQPLLMPSFEPDKQRLEEVLRISSDLPRSGPENIESLAAMKGQVASVLSSFRSNHIDGNKTVPSFSAISRENMQPLWKQRQETAEKLDRATATFFKSFSSAMADLLASTRQAALQTEIIELP